MSDENRTNGSDVTEIEDDPRKVRLAKREALLAAGKFPYGMRFIIETAQKHNFPIPTIENVYQWGASIIS